MVATTAKNAATELNAAAETNAAKEPKAATESNAAKEPKAATESNAAKEPNAVTETVARTEPNAGKARTAAVIGATGLIGGYLAELLSRDDQFTKVRLITRRVPENVPHGTEVVVIDFEDPAAFSTALNGIDTVFCAVGTTRKKVKGDMDAYRKIDHDIPVNAARHCKDTGCRHFSLVSSVGASSKSGNFYLRFKGEAEEAAASIGLSSVAVFRPSMLMGKRKEFRLAEEIAKIFSSPLSFLFPAKYRPIRGFDVARAMIVAAKSAVPGFRVYHFTEMMALTGK